MDLRRTFEGPHALFTLPLDASKANPAAVEQFIDDSGFDREWFTTVGPDDGTTYTTRETDTEDGKHIEILPQSEELSADDLSWLTADEFADYVNEELADMDRQVKDGVLSQENRDKEAGELAQQLEAIRNGSAMAARLDGDGMSVILFPSPEDLENAVKNANDISIRKTEDGISMSIK